MKIIFATNNAHKLQEVQNILGEDFTLLTPKDCGVTEEIPEDQPTIEGNALQKAQYLQAKTGENCFADDTGLEVDALNGEPGVYSARYAGEDVSFDDNMNLLLKNLEGKTNRSAKFKTVIALILNDENYLFEGIIEGEITTEKSGAQGFGYDPIFKPKGYDVTFAEMSAELKNTISHRALAVKKLNEFLQAKK